LANYIFYYDINNISLSTGSKHNHLEGLRETFVWFANPQQIICIFTAIQMKGIALDGTLDFQSRFTKTDLSLFGEKERKLKQNQQLHD